MMLFSIAPVYGLASSGGPSPAPDYEQRDPSGREGLILVAVDIHRRRVIGMHGENGRVAELCEDHAPQVSIDFADAVVVA